MGSCPACGAKTPGGARFCPACGARQYDHAIAAPPSERRMVTTLFCDMVGFTSLCEQADAEDVDALLRSYHQLVRRVIEQYGGGVEKFIGDAVVGVFGAPTAHEDDAERAVRAAVRLQARIADLEGPRGAPVQVRVGINTGEALVRLDVDPASGEGFLAGDAVNTASRLQSIAPPGGIVIGDVTHALTRGVATSEVRDPVRLKGKAEPSRTWLVTGLVARPGVDLERAFSTPHVGREVESGILQGLFKKTVASSTPQFALIVAEPGLGKSRLVHELAGWLDRQPDVLAQWRQADCPAFEDGLSVWPMAEIVRQHAGITDADDAGTAEAKLSAALGGATDTEWMAERLRPLLGLPSAPAPRDESFSAWLGFLELVARARPTVLVIEDLHWAGPLMAEFAAYLAETAADVPLLGVYTARPELYSAPAGTWLAATGGLPATRFTRLDLHPLSPPETERLVGILGPAENAPTRAAIVHRCGGNPLYAEELVRLEASHSEKRGRTGATEIPATLQSLVAARLDSLTPSLRAVLADAAVIGEAFDAATLSAIGSADATLGDHLSRLAERDFVRRLPAPAESGAARYAFQHAVTQEVAYSRLPRTARLSRHEAYGLWLLARPHEEDALLAARHLRTALGLADATGDGEAAARLREPTLQALAGAAEGTMALDLRESERLAREALSLVAGGDPRRAQLLVLLGRSLQRTGQLKEAQAVLEEAAQASGPGDTATRASALVSLADTLLDLGESRAVHVADESLALLGDAPSPELVAALELRAALHLTQDEPEQARALAETSRRAAARLGLPEPLRTLEMIVLASCLLGDVDDGMREAERLHTLLATNGHPGRLPGIFGGLAELTLVYRSAGQALEVSVEGRRLAEERHDLTGWATCRVAEMEDTFFLGRWQGLGAALDDLARTLAEADGRFSLVDVLDFRLLLALLTGAAPDDGLDALVSAPQEGEVHGNLALSFLAQALREAASGRTDAALSMLDRMDSHTVNFSSIPSLMLWWSVGTRLALELGAEGPAARLAGRLLESPAAPRPAVATASAALAQIRGDLDAATGLFEDSANAWREHGVPFEYGHARMGQAESLAGSGRAPEAIPLYAEAADVFRRLGAAPSLVVAERLLARARARS